MKFHKTLLAFENAKMWCFKQQSCLLIHHVLLSYLCEYGAISFKNTTLAYPFPFKRRMKRGKTGKKDKIIKEKEDKAT